MDDAAREACKKRLKRIEGQVRGLSRMVEEDRYCIDIITQISAVRAALRRVEQEVLRDHIGHCVKQAMRSDDVRSQDRTINELIDVLARSDG
jgi:DNA-binding FrmR family transcriptional regulator